MIEPPDPTRTRDLAETLRALRKAAGMTGAALGRAAAMSQGKISKIETGKVVPTVVDVQRIIKALGVPPVQAQRLLDMAQAASTQFRSIRYNQRLGLHRRQAELAAIEGSSSCVRYFLPAMLPGLLQLPEYARTILTNPAVSGGGDSAKALAARMERQAVLHRQQKRFEFILTEQALRWPLVPPSLMAVQLEHVAAVSAMENVTLGVLPLVRPDGATIVDGPINCFALYDTGLATVETFSGQLALHDPDDVAYYADLFEFFMRAAVTGEAARVWLRGAAATCRGERPDLG